MICQSCKDRTHEACESVDCGCRHCGSDVRPLTGQERHEFMLGLRQRHLLPVGSPYVPPAPKAVIPIRTTLNGSHQ